MGQGKRPLVPLNAKLTTVEVKSGLVKGLGGFTAFASRYTPNKQIVVGSAVPVTGDVSLSHYIKQLAGIKHCQDVSSLPKEQRDAVLSDLKQKGCSVRQIARLTGVNRGIIHRAWRSADA